MINPSNIQNIMPSAADSKIEKLEDLKKIKDEQKLKQAAQDFEAVFITKMFDVLNSTVQRDGFLSGGKSTKMFKTFMHQELAKQISSNPETSFGLAAKMYEQMKDLV